MFEVIAILFLYAFIGSFFGIATLSLASQKGYKGYFAVGFLFNLLGLFYVMGLPISKERASDENRELALLTAKPKSLSAHL